MSDTPTADPASLPPAGWYPDPMDAQRQRWWTGAEWTDHLVDPATGSPLSEAVETPGPDPAQRVYVPMADYDASAWTSSTALNSTPGSGYTLAIWLLACTPILYFILIVAEYRLALNATPSVQTSLSADISGLVVLTIVLAVWVLLAIWDYATLKNRGLPAPTPVWVLLSILAYFIARRIVLKRVDVRANAPGNVLVLLVLAGAISSGFFVANSIAQQGDVLAIKQFESYVSQQLNKIGTHKWTVECPDDAPASTTGATFTCSATAETGVSANLTVNVTSPHTFKIVATDPVPQNGTS
jgi:Protein of unknown function (DUF2510)/Domain of unknown function (DUF4333)